MGCSSDNPDEPLNDGTNTGGGTTDDPPAPILNASNYQLVIESALSVYTGTDYSRKLLRGEQFYKENQPKSSVETDESTRNDEFDCDNDGTASFQFHRIGNWKARLTGSWQEFSGKSKNLTIADDGKVVLISINREGLPEENILTPLTLAPK